MFAKYYLHKLLITKLQSSFFLSLSLLYLVHKLSQRQRVLWRGVLCCCVYLLPCLFLSLLSQPPGMHAKRYVIFFYFFLSETAGAQRAAAFTVFSWHASINTRGCAVQGEDILGGVHLCIVLFYKALHNLDLTHSLIKPATFVRP